MKSLIKAIDVLEILAKTEEPEMGISEISRLTGINKVIVHNIVRTFVDRGLVAQNEKSKRYRLGELFFELAGSRAGNMRPLSLAKPYLHALWLETQETVHFTVPSGTGSVVLDIHESPHPIRFAGKLGQRAPLHCTASGKVFLAFGTGAWRDEILQGELTTFTPNTRINVKALHDELATVRSQGFSIDHEEFLQHLNAVAAPIFDANEKCVAAVAVLGPASRLLPNDLLTHSASVVRTANNISSQLKLHPGVK